MACSAPAATPTDPRLTPTQPPKDIRAVAAIPPGARQAAASA